PEPDPRPEGKPARTGRAGARPGHVPGRPAARPAAPLTGAPSARDHRVRASPQRADRAPVPRRGMAQLREETVGASAGARLAGDAGRACARALDLATRPLTPSLPGPGLAEQHPACALPS